MRTAHRIVGFAFIFVFLLTGVYMRTRFPDAFQDDAGMRMMFRATHVYILFAALLNVAVGAYLRSSPGTRRSRARSLGSALLLASPALFTVAFFVEPAPGRLDRPITLVALVLALAGTLLHAWAISERSASGPASPSR